MIAPSKVAVTGATGFIGSKLVDLLLETGDQVRILTRRDPSKIPFAKSVQIFSGDISSRETNLRAFADGVDALYHCAGEVNDPARMVAVNVDGTRRLLEAASGRVGRWIQLSSVGAYGPRSDGMVTEETPEAPQGIYETTKTESDRLVREAERTGQIQAVVLRPSNVYGPKMTNPYLHQLIWAIRNRLFFFIGQPGASANYIHVQNVAEALISCGRLPQAKGHLYNLSDYRTLEQFVEIVLEASSRKPPRMRVPELPIRFLVSTIGFLPGFPLTRSRLDVLVNRCIYNNDKIQRELGYAHKVSMEDGLREMILLKKYTSQREKKTLWSRSV